MMKTSWTLMTIRILMDETATIGYNAQLQMPLSRLYSCIRICIIICAVNSISFRDITVLSIRLNLNGLLTRNVQAHATVIADMLNLAVYCIIQVVRVAIMYIFSLNRVLNIYTRTSPHTVSSCILWCRSIAYLVKLRNLV